MADHRLKLIATLITVLFITTGLPVTIATPAPNAADKTATTLFSAFPWQTFNRNLNVTTFAGPDGGKTELWHFLTSAQQGIYVEIFGINNPYILELILQLHTTKPSLVIRFLIGWNSLGYPEPNKYVANNLTVHGIPVRWTNAGDFAQAHQKFVIIDNKTILVHSGNWAKTSFPEAGKVSNREWNIAVTDTQIAAYFRSVFDYDWQRGTPYNSGTHGTGTALTYTETGSTYPRPFASAGHFSGLMNITPIVSPDTSKQGLLACINSAQATLDIQIPYFTDVGGAGAVDDVIAAIVAAKARGVTVRVITAEDKDWLEIQTILISHGIPIAWQDTRWFSALHNKGIIVDGRIVLVSSINYSDESITQNREAGFIIENDQVAQWYQAVYDYDWGLADCDAMNSVNVYWEPNIPKDSSPINVTVYGQMLYGSGINEVELDVKIGGGSWSNHTITANVYNSPEGQAENFYYIIGPQADGTDITVVGRIRTGSTWHTGLPMVIHVRNALGTTLPTTTTTTEVPIPGFPWAGIILGLGLVLVPLLLIRRRRQLST